MILTGNFASVVAVIFELKAWKRIKAVTKTIYSLWRSNIMWNEQVHLIELEHTYIRTSIIDSDPHMSLASWIDCPWTCFHFEHVKTLLPKTEDKRNGRLQTFWSIALHKAKIILDTRALIQTCGGNSMFKVAR